jgi:hypothetical protein
MKTIKIIQEIYSDIGPRGEDYGVPYLEIDPDILEKNGYKVGDIVEITITPNK